MKNKVKTAQNDGGESPYSPALCVLLLLVAGLLVKFTATGQVFHAMH